MLFNKEVLVKVLISMLLFSFEIRDRFVKFKGCLPLGWQIQSVHKAARGEATPSTSWKPPN